MVDPYLRKACLLTALLCLVALPSAAASPPDNADDGQQPSQDGEPCEAVQLDPDYPFVEAHPECIGP